MIDNESSGDGGPASPRDLVPPYGTYRRGI